jgi:hypothetical protein
MPCVSWTKSEYKKYSEYFLLKLLKDIFGCGCDEKVTEGDKDKGRHKKYIAT